MLTRLLKGGRYQKENEQANIHIEFEQEPLNLNMRNDTFHSVVSYVRGGGGFNDSREYFVWGMELGLRRVQAFGGASLYDCIKILMQANGLAMPSHVIIFMMVDGGNVRMNTLGYKVYRLSPSQEAGLRQFVMGHNLDRVIGATSLGTSH